MGGTADREHGAPTSCFQRCGAYPNVDGLCLEVHDGIGALASVGRADFKPSRRRGVWRQPRLSAVGRHEQVACGRNSELAGRLLPWHQCPDRRAPRHHAQFPCIHMPASCSTEVDRFLFAGCFQSRGEQERMRLCGSSLLPLRGSVSSVGLGVLLRRCAAGAAWIGCPCTLLTSCCVHAWQDRSRACLRASLRTFALWWPTLRAVRAGVRLIGVSGRSEERDRRDCAML